MGGDGGDVEDPRGVSPPRGPTYHRDEEETCGGREVGISTSGGGTGSSVLTTN